MATTWGQIREEFADAFRDTTTGFFGNSAGANTEVVRVLRRVLRLIDAPEAYTFQEQEYTLSLTGASRYDLDTLIPGWKRIKAINANQSGSPASYRTELQAVELRDFQSLQDSYSYAIFQSRYLELYNPTGVFSSGSLKIIYYTGYLVKDGSTGALKALPTSDSDTFLIPDRFLDVITEGLAMLAFRKDRSNKEDYRDALASFNRALLELRDMHSVTVESPVRRMTGAF